MEFLLVFLALVISAAFGIKYRTKIAKWLNDPNTNHNYRKRVLKRRIEDAEDELARIDKEDQEVKAETRDS